MSDTSQNKFISHWNSIAKKLSKHKLFKNIPHFHNGLFSGGACCGFSFALAEYVKEEKPEEFYNLYNFICLSKPEVVADFIIKHLIDPVDEENSEEKNDKRFANKLIDFIYKIYILSEKQQEFITINEGESQNAQWMRIVASSPNHLRIGSKIDTKNLNVGEILGPREFENLPNIIDNRLNENESLEIGFNSKNFSHSILVYRLAHCFEVFDSNIGKKVIATSAQDAAKEVIYSLNKSITNGTDKYTLFDKLWNKSRFFKVGAVIALPITASWLAYDVFLAKPESEDTLKEKPLDESVCLSWGKVAKP